MVIPFLRKRRRKREEEKYESDLGITLKNFTTEICIIIACDGERTKYPHNHCLIAFLHLSTDSLGHNLRFRLVMVLSSVVVRFTGAFPVRHDVQSIKKNFPANKNMIDERVWNALRCTVESYMTIQLYL